MENQPIAGIGEVLWDLFPDRKTLGGGTANFAYHVSQFGFNSVVVSAIGNDPLGEEIVRSLDERGVAHNLQRVDFPTGTVEVTLGGEGIPSYDIRENVAWDHIGFTPSLETLAEQCAAVCFGSLAQRSEVSRRTINLFLDRMQEDSLRIFDINLRQHFYTEETILNALHKCNILKINEEELTVLSHMFGYAELNPRAACRAIVQDYALQALILTCGAEGSYVFTPDETSYCDTPKVKVVDTVGAGDSFTGAFCAALLYGKPIRVAHRLAVEVSAYVCTQQGGMPRLPETFTGQLTSEEG